MALLTSSAALLPTLALLGEKSAQFQPAALRILWCAAVWLAISLLWQWPALFTAFQIALVTAVLLSATGIAGHALLDPRTLQAQGISLSVLSLAWLALRLTLHRSTPSPTIAALLDPPWFAVDRILPFGLLILAVLLAVIGVAPAIGRELDGSILSPIGGAAVHALDGGSWLLLILLAIVFLASLWDRFRNAAVLAMLVLSGAGCLLLAGRADASRSAASAWRWLSAAMLVIGSVPLWLRQPMRQACARLGWPDFAQQSENLGRLSMAALFILTIAPILILTLYRAAMAFSGAAAADPAPESLLHRIGSTANYIPPLAIMMFVLIGHALHRRSPALAFSAAMVMHLTISLAYALSIVTGGQAMASPHWVRLLQFNAIGGGLYSLGWLAVLRFRDRENQRLSPLLVLHRFLVLLMLLAPLTIGEITLLIDPAHVPAALAESLSSTWGWMAAAIAGATVLWAVYFALPSAGASCGILIVIGSLAAQRLAASPQHGWLAYHLLLVSRAVAGMLMLPVGLLLRSRAAPLSRPRQSPAASSRWGR